MLLICLAAGVVLAGIGLSARSRVEANAADALAAQRMRLQRAQTVAADFFADAFQLVQIDAATVGRLTRDRTAVRGLLADMMVARRNRSVYGIGFFYAPHVFAGPTATYGPYMRDIGGKIAGLENDNAATYDYTRLNWYGEALRHRGSIVVDGPYPEDGSSLISTMEAVYVDHKLRGVATVDTLTSKFKGAVTSGLGPGDVAYVTDPSGAVTFATSPLRADRASTIEVSGPIRYTRATLHLLHDGEELRTENARVVASAILGGLATLLVAAGLAVVILGVRRSRLAALALRDELKMRAEIESRLRKAAFTDELTGLPNRSFLRDHLQTSAGPDGLSLFVVDIDRFAILNETFGQAAGDELLIAVGRRLAAAGAGTLARLGAHRFGIVREGPASTHVAEMLLSSFDTAFALRGIELFVTASIGFTDTTAHAGGAAELMRDAGIALHQAKSNGGACCVRFAPAMGRIVIDELAQEATLRHAIDLQQFVAHYQPVVNAATGRVASFEALARWQPPGRDVVAAEHFIKLAENRGLIAHIDNLILHRVVNDFQTIARHFPGAPIAINVSALHLSDVRLARGIAAALSAAGMEPSQLRVEITETAVMRDAERSLSTLMALHELGVRIIVDDFGVGYSSLAYLQRFPISGVKIDRSFISALDADSYAHAIVRSIVALADTLGIYVVAEGIETPSQAQMAFELGVPYLQGYLFSPPVAIDEVSALDAVTFAVHV